MTGEDLDPTLKEDEDTPMFVSDQANIELQKTPVQISDPRSAEVVLMSAGKLSLPPRIKVRDYNMDDATRLAMANNDSILEAVLEVFKNIIQTPGINVLEIHEEEAKQVLVYLLLNFWNNELERYPYKPNEEDLAFLLANSPKKYAAVTEGREDLKCTVVLADIHGQSKIQMTPIAEEFNEPFALTQADGTTVAFRLPRLGDLLIAQQLSDEKTASEELSLYDVKETLGRIDSLKEDLAENEGKIDDALFDLEASTEEDKSILQANIDGLKRQSQDLRDKIFEVFSSINPAKRRRFDAWQKEKQMMFLRFKQASCLVAFNKKPLTDLDEKLKAYTQVGLNTWKTYAEIVRKYSFGIDSKLTVTSPVTRRPVEMTVQFRILDLVPAGEAQLPGEPEIRFGALS